MMPQTMFLWVDAACRFAWEDVGVTTWDKLPYEVIRHFKVVYAG